MFSAHSKLAIAILVYYTLALPIAVLNCIKHGFGRHGGWLYLVSMAIVRIIGACLTIAAEQKPSTGLYVAAAIFSAIGLVPLLLTLMGTLKRVNDGIHAFKQLPPRAFQLTHLVTLVGLILSIIAGSQSSSTKPSTVQDVRTERKAGATLLLASAILNSLIAIFLLTRIKHAQIGDRVLLYCALGSIPFLLARVIYGMLLAFAHGSAFNPISPNIYLQAFMQILMEMICFTLYAASGRMAPKMEPEQYTGNGSQLLRGKFGEQHEMEPRGQTSGVVKNRHAPDYAV